MVGSHVCPVDPGSQKMSLSRGVTILFVLYKERSGWRTGRWQGRHVGGCNNPSDGWLDRGCGMWMENRGREP